MSRAAAILAARSVAAHLAQPTPELLNAIAAVKGCGLLTQSLPLADALPFGGLPDAAAEPDVGYPAPVRAAGMDLPRPAVAASAQPGQSAEQKPGGGEQPPVFSFRRGSATAVQPAPSRAETDGVKAGDAVERANSAPEAPGIVRREGSPVSSVTAAISPTPIETTPAAGVRRPGHRAGAIALVDALATELLAAPVLEPLALRTGAHPVSGAEARLVASASPREIPAGVVSHLGIDNRSLTVAAQNQPLRDAHVSEFVETPDRSRTAPSPLQSMAGAPGDTVQNPPAPEASAFSHLDAETLASMVNEVLAEQARRHGVDLS